VETSWHLDKKIPIGLIFAILTQFAMVIMAYTDLRKDIELLKQDAAVLHQRDTQQASDMKEAMAQVRDQFKSLSEKLDRLIERGAK
jgi:lipid II:glycine glycyltransferase (peptidoglycan interpeptide bridge formation enzyme)